MDVNARIEDQLKSHEVLLYMKGTPDFPQCGFSGQTVAALNAIGKPLALYCKPADDMLPQPGACLVTGITPQQALAEGLPEREFIDLIHTELALPGTCGVGYNSLRFDDEVTRYTLYRNFFDPYAREWQNGNSRWDIIDMVRATNALRQPQRFEAFLMACEADARGRRGSSGRVGRDDGPE